MNVIINFPTNLGDAVMSLPALDRIRANYPDAKLTAIVSPATRDFFLANTFVDEVVVFDKFWRANQKKNFSLSLRGKYDIIFDLKNSFLPFLLGIKKRTPFVRKFPSNAHAKDIYLKIIEKLAPRDHSQRSDFMVADPEQKKWNDSIPRPSIFLSCSSHSEAKQYPHWHVQRLVELLKNNNLPPVIVGEERDRSLYKDITNVPGTIDLLGKTKMAELFYLLKNFSHLLICVDSAILHLGSYLNLPIVAIFGPTDPQRYGPWSKSSIVVKSTQNTSMDIAPELIVEAMRRLLDNRMTPNNSR